MGMVDGGFYVLGVWFGAIGILVGTGLSFWGNWVLSGFFFLLAALCIVGLVKTAMRFT